MITVEGQGWTQEESKVLRMAVEEMSTLGTPFKVVPNGGDVVVRSAKFWPCTRHSVGQFVIGSRLIEVDPLCTEDNSYLQQAFMHELGHFIGMRHILRTPSDVGVFLSPLPPAPAVMNPNMYYGDGVPFLPATTTFTSSDLEEYWLVSSSHQF